MSVRGWVRRLLVVVTAYVVLAVVLTVLDFEPDLLRLGLVTALGATVVLLLLDTLPDSTTAWDVHGGAPVTPPGQDPRTSTYLRILEGHLTARAPDGALRHRLGLLADQVLAVRHGVARADPEADVLLGPELLRVLSEPPRRLSRAEIDRCVTRIEEL